MTCGVSWTHITAGQSHIGVTAKTPSDLRRYPPENSQLPRGRRLLRGESGFFFGPRAELAGGHR